MFSEDRPVGNPAQIFRSFLKNKGLRNTPQRQQIMEVFFNESGHLTTEEIYDRVRKEDPSLGQATVYRTMKLLCEAGLAREVRFGDGLARYEHAADAHHDHLICENCGHNIEVVDSQIEELQDALSRLSKKPLIRGDAALSGPEGFLRPSCFSLSKAGVSHAFTRSRDDRRFLSRHARRKLPSRAG